MTIPGFTLEWWEDEWKRRYDNGLPVSEVATALKRARPHLSLKQCHIEVKCIMHLERMERIEMQYLEAKQAEEKAWQVELANLKAQG
jgi:hypothetical protein